MQTELETPRKELGRHATSTQAVRDRAEALLRTEIDFIPNPEVATEDQRASDFIESTLTFGKAAAGAPTDLPTHLRRLCETALLTHEEESSLFREMNLLKYQANVLRSRIDPKHAEDQQFLAVETLLKRVEVIRDHIIQANMRLVISIVKKFITPQHSFDDMLSDGIYTLMKSVEKFDFYRSFRFSTYAYRSIAPSLATLATPIEP
ncbi:MAG: sigma factor [Planctomycetales bacterium]